MVALDVETNIYRMLLLRWNFLSLRFADKKRGGTELGRPQLLPATPEQPKSHVEGLRSKLCGQQPLCVPGCHGRTTGREGLEKTHA